MTITIDLTPQVEADISARAQARGLTIEEYVRKVVAEQGLPRTMEELMARIQVPPGETNGLADIIGQWPGDETDEEVRAALEELS